MSDIIELPFPICCDPDWFFTKARTFSKLSGVTINTDNVDESVEFDFEYNNKNISILFEMEMLNDSYIEIRGGVFVLILEGYLYKMEISFYNSENMRWKIQKRIIPPDKDIEFFIFKDSMLVQQLTDNGFEDINNSIPLYNFFNFVINMHRELIKEKI